MTEAGAYPITYAGYYDDDHRSVQGVVPVEEEITLHVNGQPLVRLFCTPVQLEELALGFLFTEELVEEVDEVEEAKVLQLRDGRRWVDIWLRHEVEPGRLRAVTSGCSGGTVFGDTGEVGRGIESSLRVTPQQITRLMAGLARSAVIYRRTGGLHVAALADGEQLVCVAEDIGRHNAVDKIVGTCLQEGWPMRDHVLLSSGRISSDMVSKAVRMGVPVIVSRTAPTSLAVQLAQACDIALVGYTRRRSFRVYTGEARVVAPECPG